MFILWWNNGEIGPKNRRNFQNYALKNWWGGWNKNVSLPNSQSISHSVGNFSLVYILEKYANHGIGIFLEGSILKKGVFKRLRIRPPSTTISKAKKQDALSLFSTVFDFSVAHSRGRQMSWRIIWTPVDSKEWRYLLCYIFSSPT